MATHSNILAWEILWTGRLYSPWGCKRVRHDLATKQQQKQQQQLELFITLKSSFVPVFLTSVFKYIIELRSSSFVLYGLLYWATWSSQKSPRSVRFQFCFISPVFEY